MTAAPQSCQPRAVEAPLPWTATANSWQHTTIYDAGGHAICRLDLEDWGVNEENQDRLEKGQAEVTALILDAVNSHATLKARIQELEGTLNSVTVYQIEEEGGTRVSICGVKMRPALAGSPAERALLKFDAMQRAALSPKPAGETGR